MNALALCLLLATAPPSGPVEFGRRDLHSALAAAGLPASRVAVSVKAGGVAESFVIRLSGGKAMVVGADPNGAMYGALEMAERLRAKGKAALSGADVKGRAFLRERGLNLFLTLPWNLKANDTDADPAALIDPNRWWFQNDDYWRTLLDLMARSRLNWLDIHGAWDISVTDAPNLYAYFIQSKRYREVGVSADIKAANLKRLNWVIDQAHARGIRVSLMSYQAGFNTPQNRTTPYKESEPLLYDYTREVVEGMIRQAPGLDAIGFRIGESGKSGEFFNCYEEAVRRSGRRIPLITRSWLTRKANVAPLARQSSDFTVEVKYNGEQWGVSYLVAGGRVANWHSYSFEDYLSDSGGPAKRMWPGNPTPEGGRWPDEPYKIVWQVRANGTHRIFPFYEPDMVRRTIREMKVGTASGYTVEGLDAYFPKDPAYYLADPADRYCNWIHERDEVWWAMWGRLGYDPATPDAVFEGMLKKRFGSGAPAVSRAWRLASRIVPRAYAAFSLGPDHRSHAPELEFGGGDGSFLWCEAFDSFSYRSVAEDLAYRALGVEDGRISPQATVADLLRLSRDAEAAARQMATSNPAEVKRLKELRTAVGMLSALGEYYAGRFSSAYGSGPEDAAGLFRRAWTTLSESDLARYYKPFTDRLRMHTNSFHWANELPLVNQVPRLLGAAAKPRAAIPTPRQALTWTASGPYVIVRLRAEGASAAWLLQKPLPSSTYFHRSPMKRVPGGFRAAFLRRNWGHLVAADLKTPDGVMRVPGPEGGAPYLVVPSLPGPTPPIYSAQEALAHLDPKSVTLAKYGLMVMGTRSSAFSWYDRNTQRKVLDPVRRGMTLLVLQQDLEKCSPAWLPNPPAWENAASDRFEPAGALGLKPITAPGIVWQRFLPTPGWNLYADGALAHAKIGLGDVWLVQARLVQNLSVADCAKALATLICLNARNKTALLLDNSTECSELSSSVLPDLMNALGVPFKTLGEVVAEEQGMSSVKVVPGKVCDDAVLGGRGEAMLDAFVRGKVKRAAAKEAPASSGAFELQRAAQRQGLMRSLGLDPLPERTPLNARVTGGFQRPGYRVENVVIDSRPGFPVTMNVYVPDAPRRGKLPVIVHVHGHWAHKKAEPTVQSRAIFSALHGYIAVVVDSPGFSFEGDAAVERRYAGTHFDLKLTLGSANATAVYVWDTMRALDYLETRPDADMTRVGITGASGGGLATVYAFAADRRFRAAVPVVYASSLEVNPDNGCQCNHVPGTLQVGDRSDVLAVRAPAPVLIIGAQDDLEFPPEGMRRSGEKLKRIWKLFRREGDAVTALFPGGHDYSRPMRELMIGFFDRHLRGIGDGRPVPEPQYSTEPADSKELVCLPDPPQGLLTMTEIAWQRLALHDGNQPFADLVALNGGLPTRRVVKLDALGETGPVRHVTIETDRGLAVPGILRFPERIPRGVLILLADGGKVQAERLLGAKSLVELGFATLALDVRGTGELAPLDLRLMAYLGEGAPFGMGWDAARAADAVRVYSPKVAVVGTGPCAAQAALFATLMEPCISVAAGLDGPREFADLFAPDVPELAIQPRADLAPSLSHLRSLVGSKGFWGFRGERQPNWVEGLRSAFPTR